MSLISHLPLPCPLLYLALDILLRLSTSWLLCHLLLPTRCPRLRVRTWLFPPLTARVPGLSIWLRVGPWQFISSGTLSCANDLVCFCLWLCTGYWLLAAAHLAPRQPLAASLPKLLPAILSNLLPLPSGAHS